MLGRLRITIAQSSGQKVIEDTEHDFYHKTTAFTHTMYFSGFDETGFSEMGNGKTGFDETGFSETRLNQLTRPTRPMWGVT